MSGSPSASHRIEYPFPDHLETPAGSSITRLPREEWVSLGFLADCLPLLRLGGVTLLGLFLLAAGLWIDSENPPNGPVNTGPASWIGMVAAMILLGTSAVMGLRISETRMKLIAHALKRRKGSFGDEYCLTLLDAGIRRRVFGIPLPTSLPSILRISHGKVTLDFSRTRIVLRPGDARVEKGGVFFPYVRLRASFGEKHLTLKLRDRTDFIPHWSYYMREHDHVERLRGQIESNLKEPPPPRESPSLLNRKKAPPGGRHEYDR